MIGKGLVKLGNFTAAEDKRQYAYVLTPKGFKEKSDAVTFINHYSAQLLQEVLTKPSPGNSTWRLDSNATNVRCTPVHENDIVRIIRFKSFKLVNENGY